MRRAVDGSVKDLPSAIRDRGSSIRNNSDRTARVYEKRNYSGRRVCITRSGGSIHDLRGYNLNDQTRSLKMCVRLGLAPGDEGEAFGSKYRYVMKQLRPLAVPELTVIARKVLDEYEAPELDQVLASLGMTGVDGEFRSVAGPGWIGAAGRHRSSRT
ncbi:hypothetical protein OK006_8983 [Actinobacteria bacterium OK006]|nr:hypothetical protein OK006_8983 [Actinobacteria bacterium OK006]